MFKTHHKIHSNTSNGNAKTVRNKRLSECRCSTVDADIVFTGALYIIYKQFQLDDNFKTYLEGTMQSEHVLKSGIKPTPYQKSFELVTGAKPQLVGFTGGNKQLSFVAISLVYDKCDQDRCISNS